VFDRWKLVMQPTLQTAHEYEGAARDFVDFLGDIPVEALEQNDLLDYHDEARHLPSTMPKVDRALSFNERLDRHRRSDTARIGAPTLKKRIGGIQALLSFGKGQESISRDEGRDVPGVGYTKVERYRGRRSKRTSCCCSPAACSRPPAVEARSCSG
jgi:hypothetical protein